MTLYTYRMTVVVRAARAVDANAAAHEIDPTGGDLFADARLRFLTSVPTAVDAYWSSWQMMPSEGTSLRTALKNHGFSNREVGMVAGGAQPNINDALWAFDAAAWTPPQVLAALGMTTSDFSPITH